MDLNQRLTDLLRGMGADLVGFGDVAGLAPDGYQTAVVAAIALPPHIIDDIPVGPTPAYLETYGDYNRRLDEMSDAAAALLEQEGYRTLSMNREHAPWSRETMASPFPHKTSATRAGLGWIGKCALLVTPEYGSAVRLTVTLTDAPLEVAQPITQSRCGDCTACMEACPGHAVRGALWQAGLPREAMVDIPACDKTAGDCSEKTLGKRTTICGRCFAACPYTKAYVARIRQTR
ncbi:MAG: epoxyqueuosine reductase [Clostridia bacterium]|nr:epoxyqueuosine reductase [Clostridia bacterium]